ncbi:hypothetical protein ACN47E_000456 [Coniothyrium glycines]
MAARDISPTSTSSTRSNITVRTDKQAPFRAMSSASPSSSTPPTSLDDAASVLSDIAKVDQAVELYNEALPQRVADGAAGLRDVTADTAPDESRRPARSSRKSVPTYNVQILAGTAIHTPTKYLEKHHKNVVHGNLESVKQESVAQTRKRSFRLKFNGADASDAVEQQLVTETAQAVRRRTSSRLPDLRKEVLSSKIGDAIASPLSAGRSLAHKELRRAASDSRLKSTLSSSSSSTSLKRPHTAAQGGEGTADGQTAGEEKPYVKPASKVWLRQGLYVGQHRGFDARLSESQNRVRKRARISADNSVLPLPMFACERLLNEDPKHVFRDFKLPFDIYNPLPKKVKVDGWVKLHRNRFIGEASSLWKKDKQDSSQCYCDPEDGCGEACHNRIMAYECDNTNCRLSADECRNRPFAELKRRSKGNRYDYGVEVLDTEDRGYGVRTMRPFQPHQIIVEYAGEIITQQECERRMKQVYRKDKCYYLMSFDNKMIIDATRGTIARFVNHSCEPNCEMIKWTVNGEPRMALFAGSKGVMTGEELTYDYNFDPFSQKNIQICRCGTASCRGVLGPKPKKPVEEKSITSTIISGTKRKIQNILNHGRGRSQSDLVSFKKRKLDLGSVAATKAQNAVVRSEIARERAEREAHEHSKQVASREDRALKRSATEGPSRRVRPVIKRSTRPTVAKITRHTTISFQHKLPKSGALKSISRLSNIRSVLRTTNQSLHNRKRDGPHQRPTTPVQDSSVEMKSEGDDSPNITPACLRSASRKAMQGGSQGLSPVHGRAIEQSGTGNASSARKGNLIGTHKENRHDEMSKLFPIQSRSRSTRGRGR